MKQNATLKIVLTALFAALTCVATMLVHIPIPATGGYANLGDGVILLCAFLLDPMCAVAAAGIGSMLADMLLGYMVYAPGTLVIKAVMALIAALIYNAFGRKRSPRRAFAFQLAGGIGAEIFMVLGYFFYEAVILGSGLGATEGILLNVWQAVVGVIVASILTPILSRSKEVMEIMDKTR